MFHKDTFRLIKKTRKRFVTILLIVLIGVGFMVGLMSSEPTMRASVNQYYKDTNFMDLQLFSSFGFDDGDIEALQSHRDVKEVYGTKFVDAFARGKEGDVVTRVQEINCNMNRFTLTEGRMPRRNDEALALGSSSYGTVFQIGDTVDLYLDDEDLSESLAVTRYKIVGIVKTPQYMASSKETSTLNNLSLSTVIYTDNSNFLREYYTSVYLTFKGSEKFTAFSDEYKDFIQEKSENLDKLIKVQEKILAADIMEEVQQEIADGERELEEETAKARKEIEDGKKELADARIEIADGEKKIADGWAELRDGEKELEKNEDLLKDSQKQLDDGKNQILSQLDPMGITEWDKAGEYAKENYTSLLSVYPLFTDIEATITALNNRNTALQRNIENIKTRLTNPNLTPEETANLQNQLSALQTTVEDNNTNLRFFQRILDDCNKIWRPLPLSALKLADKYTTGSLQDAVDTLNTDMAALTGNITALTAQIDAIKADSGKTEAEKSAEISAIEGNIALIQSQLQIMGAQHRALTGLLQNYPPQTPVSAVAAAINIQLPQIYKLHISIVEINKGRSQINDGMAEIEKGKEKLKDAKAELIKAEADLEEGKQEYLDGLQEIADGEKELEEETEKALIDIAKAKQELADLPDAEWTVLDHEMHYSTYMFDNNSTQMGKIGYVFPLLFFLVAGLVCMTTMKRLVDEERSQIGIFSALGFSKRQIISKYVIYAFSAAITGSVVAIPIGMAIFPTVVYFCWRLMYDLPDMILTMPAWIVLLGIGSFTFVMVTVTYIVVRSVLKEKPSMLMRPKAPKNAKKIFLEKIPFIWKRLSFTSKVTARNIIRYKSRFFMTVIGVAGCTGLLVLGFALKDSISQVVSFQYGNIIKYDTTVVLEDSDYLDKMMSALAEDDRVIYAVPNIAYSSKTWAESGDGTISVYVMDGRQLPDVIELNTRKDKTPLSVDNGIVVSEKFTLLHDLKLGDVITVESVNGLKADVEISGICEMYAGHYMFISTEKYQQLFNERVHYDNIALTTTDSFAVIRDYHDCEEIKTISDFTAMKASFENMFDSLNIIIIVIILAAGSLALVVIMNLTEVNISERIREIATLKVLGFNNKEVYSYIFKEVFILSLIGIFIGLPLGKLELTFVMSIIDMEMVMFPTIVKPFSYFAGFGITLIFTVMVILLMRKTLRNVKMVESLKSVE